MVHSDLCLALTDFSYSTMYSHYNEESQDALYFLCQSNRPIEPPPPLIVLEKRLDYNKPAL